MNDSSGYGPGIPGAEQQQRGADAGEHVRQEEEDVVIDHRAAADRVHREDLHDGAQHVLGERERVVDRVEDVGVEDAERGSAQRVSTPREHPRREITVGVVDRHDGRPGVDVGAVEVRRDRPGVRQGRDRECTQQRGHGHPAPAHCRGFYLSPPGRRNFGRGADSWPTAIRCEHPRVLSSPTIAGKGCENLVRRLRAEGGGGRARRLTRGGRPLLPGGGGGRHHRVRAGEAAGGQRASTERGRRRRRR